MTYTIALLFLGDVLGGKERGRPQRGVAKTP